MAGTVRRVLVKVHLWLGVVLALYIVMMSLTGSAIVARRELTRYWIPDVVMAQGRMAIEAPVLRGLAQEQYPDHEITGFRENRSPVRRRAGEPPVAYPPGEAAAPVEVTFRHGETVFTHRFDPYTGRDLGDVFPAPYRAFTKLVDLHNDLLGGRSGRKINGIAAVIATLLLLTGAVLWWPAHGRGWRSRLWIRRGVPWRTQLRQLHYMLGFWPLLLLLLWASSGIYFAFPGPFEVAKDLFFPPESARAGTGDALLAEFTNLHFGRFGGTGVRVTWIVLGLVPAMLAVTGALMWWLRVPWPALRRARGRGTGVT